MYSTPISSSQEALSRWPDEVGPYDAANDHWNSTSAFGDLEESLRSQQLVRGWFSGG